MQLILSAQARDDAKDFIAWLKPLNAKSAIQARNDLGKAFDLIAKYPMANRAARTDNPRNRGRLQRESREPRRRSTREATRERPL